MKAYYFLLLFALILACSCEEDPLFESNKRVTGLGEYTSESLVVNDFSSIDLQHVANVYVATGKERKVTFTAYENILPYMEAYVAGDQLILKFNENISVNTDREIRIDVSIPSVDKVMLSGVGNFYLEGPAQKSIELELDGVGNIEAYGLQVLDAYTDINGTGNIHVDAKNKLDVDIDGLGNVYYKGSPDIMIDINGLGEVIKD